MLVSERRDDFAIINAILRCTKGKMGHLRRKVGLNHWQCQRYLARMEELGLVELQKNQQGIITQFSVTEKGRTAIGKIDDFFSWLFTYP